MSITTRTTKGSELTWNELDTNFTDLRDGVALAVPKTQGMGIKVDSLGTPTFGWHDLVGSLHTHGEVGEAVNTTYLGGIKTMMFSVGESAFIDFHIPHDYVPNTNIYIHAHWSHIAATVTGGSCTFGFELMYAKGHNQAGFSTPITITVAQNASSLQYQHMIVEGICSTTGGSPVLLNLDNIEVDGIIQCRAFLVANNILVSSGLVPKPFIHMVDIHYQSTNVATKNRSFPFYT